MSDIGFSWKFEKGYAELLNTASLELNQKSGPAVTELQVRPKDLLSGKKNLILSFSISKPLSGHMPNGFGLILDPESEIKVTIIPEGKPFLGNFRVPAWKFAVQWKLVPAVSAALFPGARDSVSALAGTHLNHTWVEIFDEDTPAFKAICAAWENCVNPFNPEQAAALSSNQVLRWNWTGIFRITAGVSWSLQKGWTVETEKLGAGFALPVKTGVQFKSKVQLSTSGHFYIQLSKKNDLLKFSLIREKSLKTSGSGSIGIDLRHSPVLKADNKLFDPLLDQAEKTIQKGLSRKLRLAVTAEASRWHRKKRIITASWQQPISEKTKVEYSSILSGKIPAPQDGFSVNGRFDNVQGREFSIKINMLNRLAGFAKSSSKFDSVIVDPEGNILFEKGVSRTDTRYRWDETEFVRLAFSRTESRGGCSFTWNWETEDSFSRKELKRLLRTILHGGVIPRFSIPGNLHFPMQLQISASTEFSGEGIARIKKTPPSLQWDTLIRALGLVHPRRYRKESFWRDWVDFAEVRQEIIRNPVHCHLDSCYPVKGRTEMQRLQVAGDYRRALRFLEVMDLWKEGMDPVGLLEKNLNFPIYLYFHMLSPPSTKKSILAVTGDWEIQWINN
jgi:hypothetical protein